MPLALISDQALREAISADDAVSINTALADIEGVLESEVDFLSARASQRNAAAEAMRMAIVEARQRAEMMSAFVVDYVSRNVTSDDVDTLLSLQSRFDGALASGNSDEITSVQLAGAQTLEDLGLTGEFKRFAASYNAPLVSEQELAQAEAANAQEASALSSATAEAKQLIGDIEAFVAAGNAFSDPIAVARSLVRLKNALDDPQLADLVNLHEALTALVVSDETYVAMTAQRHASEDAALANAIASAGEVGGRMNAFLLDYIGRNVTADNILPMVEMQASLEAALSAPQSANMVRTVESVQDQFADLGLSDQFDVFEERSTAAKISPESQTTDLGLAITMANRMLLEGDDRDFLILRNSTGSAPHLTTNLVGELAVAGKEATACWAHEPPTQDTLSFLMARRVLREKGIEQLRVTNCENVLDVDLVMIERGKLLASPPSVALPVISAFEDGRLQQLVDVAATASVEEAQRLEDEVQSLRGGIAASSIHGFGILQLDGSGGLCPIIDGVVYAHANLLAERRDAVHFYLRNLSIRESMSIERAFVAAQRSECEGIYASADDLRVLMDALDREDVGFQLLPVWIETDELDAEVARLEHIAEQEVIAATQRQQQHEAAENVEAAKRAELLDEQAERQATLRRQYEEEAAGAQKDIAELFRSFVSTGESAQFSALFPDTRAEIQRLMSNKWVVTDFSDVLYDFGTARWQDRRVKALLVKVTTQRENAPMGMYGSDCWVLGYLIDEEFRLRRDAFEAGCEDGNAIANWQNGHDMQSLWFVGQ